MKKLLLTLATACMAFTLTGCNNTTPMEDYQNTNRGSNIYHPIMKTEDGYYYNNTPNDSLTLQEDLALKYHDNTTGDDIYLCAKPECTHDGNTFCTATNERLSVSYMGMYESNIYIAAIEPGRGLNFKLLKASLDGTELSEICTVIQTAPTTESSIITYRDTRVMILHRGHAFIPYTFSYNYMSDTVTTGLAIINLSDGSVQYMPEYEHEYSKLADYYTNIIPYGDYIYYTMSKNEFHRYNFKTGEDEILPFKESLTETYGDKFSKKIKDFKNYTVIDDKVWYLCGGTKKSKASMFIYDPDENTTTLVEEFGEKLLAETTTYDKNGEPYAVSTNYCISPQPMYDGNYLYIVEQGFLAGNIEGKGFFVEESSIYEDMQVHIFTLEGERLGGFVFQRKGTCQVNVVDETFYMQTPEGTVYCSVADVIAGNIEWKELQFNQIK